MAEKILNQLFSNGQTKWFKLLNLCILLPIVLWPLVFYGTIFFFDNPKNLGITYVLFIIINAYPIYLIIITYYNSLLFKKNKAFGSLLPSAILLIIIWITAHYLATTKQDISKTISREKEREKQGFIGSINDFKIIHNKVYRYDTLIVGADARTFEIVSWDWQRDKDYYYRFGKKIDYIDRNSFTLLDYHYAKDRKYVYYDESIIEGADAKTFHHIEGTQDAKDSNSCYRWGEKVDCKVLQTEE